MKLQFERDFKSFKVRYLTPGNTERMQLNFQHLGRKVSVSKSYEVFVCFNSKITPYIWLQKRLQWIRQVLFSFSNGDRCSREGERTKKLQHIQSLSCARREHAPSRSLPSQFIRQAQPAVCPALNSSLPCLPASLQNLSLPHICVVSSIIKSSKRFGDAHRLSITQFN